MAASNDTRSSDAALAFIERLTGVARRLSTHDIVIVTGVASAAGISKFRKALLLTLTGPHY
jgi:hypothetical protein